MGMVWEVIKCVFEIFAGGGEDKVNEEKKAAAERAKEHDTKITRGEDEFGDKYKTIEGECFRCHGKGRVHGAICRKCNGTGRYKRTTWYRNEE